MDKIFDIELPQLPDPSTYGEAAKAQQGLVLAALGAMAKATWTKLAQDRMANRRRDLFEYVRSIQDPEILPDVASISLVGKRAHDIEFGRASYDLRDVLLGPGIRIKKRGDSGKGMYRSKKGTLYRFIPFRHAGPDSLGTVGQPMGSQFAALKVGAMSAPDAKNLGHFIYKAAKELKASTESVNRKTKWGERLIAGLAPKLKESHHSDIFAGMVRISKTYKNPHTGNQTTQNTYRTFRTISTANRRGWRVPATSGMHLLVALKAHMAHQAPGVVSRIISPQ